MENTKINQAVCAGRNSDQVVKFLNESHLSDEMVAAIESGLIWGVYYDESGALVAETIDGEIINGNILK